MCTSKLYITNYFEFILKEKKFLETEYNSRAFSGGSDSKESTCSVGDPSLIPGSERSTGEGNGHPLQYSFLENSVNTGAWWALVYGVTKSQTGLGN